MDEIIRINVRNDNRPNRDMSAATDNLQGQTEEGNEKNDGNKLETKRIKILKKQIKSEMRGLDYLVEELEAKLDCLVLDNKLKNIEQIRKDMGAFRFAVLELKQQEDSNEKLSKMQKIKEEMQKIIKGDIFSEGENDEDFNDLISDINKYLGDLDKRYAQYILDNNLGDFEKEQFDKIISEYKKDIQEAVTEKNKEKLEEIFVDIEARLGSEIEIQDEKLVAVNAEEEKLDIGDGEVIQEDIKDDNRKEVPHIIKKAIKDRSFAEELAAHEISKKTEDIRKNDKISKELIADDIKKIKKDVYSLIGFFDKKLGEFKKAYPEAVDFQNKISTVIDQYKEKANEFNTIKEVDRGTLVRINQLHHEMQEWADKDWVELYAKKMGMGIFEKEKDEVVLHDLDDVELHGAGASAIANKIAQETERDRKISELEDKYGKPETDYARYDETGFPIDGFTVIGYELGIDDENTFVIVKRLVDEKDVEEKIDLNKFEKDKRYIRVAENVTKADSADNVQANKKNLSSEEMEALLSLINEIKEEKGNLDIDKIELNKKFHDFLLIHKEERVFNKAKLNSIHSLHDGFAEIGRDIKQMNISGQADEALLDKIKKLDSEMIVALNADWEAELKEFNESKNVAEAGIQFNEKEKKIVEKSKEVIVKFIDKSKSEFNWDDFPQKRIAMMLEIQAVALLMREFKRRDLFIDRGEDVAEFIIKNIK
ncbi:MAG: hypothetical protein WAV16_02485 [Candidatus Moraniibacteriota bacterium]